MRIATLIVALAVTACAAPDQPPAADALQIDSAEIYHLGFIVEDLDAAMTEWSAYSGFGPFFVVRHFQFENPDYRGEPSAPDVDLAFAFNGRFMVELMQQLDETPSVYTEVRDAAGYGFHHFAYLSDDVDQSVRETEARGGRCDFRAAFTGSKLAYCRTGLMDRGYVEFVQRTADVEALLDMMYQSARNWDGSDPVRSLM